MLMHELSIAQNLLAAISAQVRQYKAKPVGVKISCGLLNAVNDELLMEAFGAISKGTGCEGVMLEIEHKPLRGICRQCGKEFDIDLKTAKCPVCGSEDFELQPDAPLVLEEIEFEGK
jgi:hydrogenase nickel incorporation protein HypA/HybF